jgi:fatty-acyl-CoA synthase
MKHPPISPADQRRADAARKRGGDMLRAISKNRTRTLTSVVAEQAHRAPDNVAIIFEGHKLTYAAFDQRINRFARWAKAEGVGAGDSVVVMVENGPDYLALWLGLNRIGAVGALINTNLSGTQLHHALTVIDAPLAVVSKCYQAQVEPFIDQRQVFWHGEGALDGEDLGQQVSTFDGGPLSVEDYVVADVDDNALFMFTSGTTGNPKAAKMSHRRVLILASGIAGAVEAGPEDVALCVLPMYHGSGGLCAPGLAFVHGGALVIERSFSVSRFWDICCDNDVTLFEYIGEICRYLANSPPHPREQDHKIRAFLGAGLRTTVWETLRDRFQIPWILEFYGSTEGNVSMSNFEGRVGAIGRVPGMKDGRAPFRIIQVDRATNEPIRNSDGLVEMCAIGEPGETIGRIASAKAESSNRFEGYSNKAETRKKVIHNVVEPGDVWFRTGDLMYLDEDEFFFFVDRVGDTFRWKAENVATLEVADILTGAPGVLEAGVYGVEIPGHEGRAGMAALLVEDEFDLVDFAAYANRELAAYARPLFLRLTGQVQVTATYKYRKIEFTEEAYDPRRVSDPLYYWNHDNKVFREIDNQVYQDIQAGKYRF